MNDCPPGINPNDVARVSFVGLIPTNILLFRAVKHNFVSGWETEYLRELVKELSKGKVLFDLGAEQGEFSAMAANVVGGENVHLFEPSPHYWPNIKRLWDVNELNQPYCFQGFISNVNDGEYKYKFNEWPDCINAPIFTDTCQISTHQKEEWGHVPKMKLDDYCNQTGVYPNIIIMDCEGAEVDIIDGALETIKKSNPVIFISVHNDDMISMYGRKQKELFDCLESLGYEKQHIYTDHEEHWKFFK